MVVRVETRLVRSLRVREERIRACANAVLGGRWLAAVGMVEHIPSGLPGHMVGAHLPELFRNRQQNATGPFAQQVLKVQPRTR